MFIGRAKERALLEQVMQDSESHFVAVYGRRRIGKTFLVRHSFGHRFCFQHAGIFEGTFKEQLFAFDASLKDAGFVPQKRSSNWLEAFESLKDLIRLSTEKRKILFIDELSWMDTPRSDFLRALEAFWNGWASARNDIVLVVCASATSWMVSRIVHNKGGLYNRLTEQIELKPFCLAECQEYVEARELAMTRHQILQCYMVFGGVPYYWSCLRRGYSLAQNIDALLFAKDAPLRGEFKYLYASVYKNPTDHIKLIEALGKKRVGMTRDELIKATGIANSGALTQKLEELESCGFIRTYHAPDKKKKGALYQLIDFFTLFHFSFLAGEPTDEHLWSNQINTPAVNAWAGYAFERVCMAHVSQIKSSLGVSGVLTQEFPWRCSSDADKGYYGSQIDLAILRKDQVANLCEMKYSACEFTVTAEVSNSIKRKIHDFSLATRERYAVVPVLVTPEGLISNAYSSVIQHVVCAKDLFE